MSASKLDSKYLLRSFDENREFLDKRYNENVEKYRKGSFTLRFDGEGERRITVKQTKHKFLFGCNAFMLGCFETPEKEPEYRRLFAKLFNQAVVPFYWKDLEPTEGHLRFHADAEPIYRRPAPDVVLDFCREYDIEPKGHCLTWQHSNPDWLAKYSDDEKKRILERRFAEIAAEYEGKIPSFDILNESPSHYNIGRKALFEGYDEYGLMLGGKYFKNSIKIANETNTGLWPSYAYSGKYMLFNVHVRDWLNKGYAIDELGLQFHMFNREDDLANNKKTFASTLDVENHVGVLDTIGEFGLPMHLSEITIPSYCGRIPENLEFQEKLVTEYYKIWFATPNMKSIVWWNLVDGYAAYAERNSSDGENYYGGGLVNYDMTEKPAYAALDRLINGEWKTNLTEKTTGSEFSFRGFYGDYEITVEDTNGVRTEIVSLREDGSVAAI